MDKADSDRKWCPRIFLHSWRICFHDERGKLHQACGAARRCAWCEVAHRCFNVSE